MLVAENPVAGCIGAHDNTFLEQRNTDLGRFKNGTLLLHGNAQPAVARPDLPVDRRA